ncbi:hypothetical protein [Actinomadura craniellae]|nr:hypothetical protein [Actinomadura craniellae]
MLSGCGNAGDGVVERSFTDRYGRACTYLYVQDQDSSAIEAENIDCDYPPTPVATGGARR